MSLIGKFGLIGVPEEQRDLLDNNTDFIVLGDVSEIRGVQMEWTLELPISGRSMNGIFRIVHNGVDANLDNFYSYIGTDEIETITFGTQIVGSDLRLTIITSGIGENPKLRYRKQTLEVAS